MNQLTRRLITATAVVGVSLAGSAAAAYAATGYAAAITATPGAPATVPVSCSSAAVWVKLWSSLGLRCYTGSGSRGVDLPGVKRGQIIGADRVCLVSNVRSVHCLRGPAGAVFQPPVQVAEIIIDRPAA
jgi:hypothetical protein